VSNLVYHLVLRILNLNLRRVYPNPIIITIIVTNLIIKVTINLSILSLISNLTPAHLSIISLGNQELEVVAIIVESLAMLANIVGYKVKLSPLTLIKKLKNVLIIC